MVEPLEASRQCSASSVRRRRVEREAWEARRKGGGREAGHFGIPARPDGQCYRLNSSLWSGRENAHAEQHRSSHDPIPVVNWLCETVNPIS